MTEQPQLVWTCRKCGRKLPTRLDICRCGTRREPGSPEEPAQTENVAVVGRVSPNDHDGETRPTASGPGVLNWVVLGAVATIVIGALVAIQVVPARKPVPPPSDPSPIAPIVALKGTSLRDRSDDR